MSIEDKSFKEQIEFLFKQGRVHELKKLALCLASMLDEMQMTHSASMIELAKLMGEDVSDEPRCKWVALILSDRMQELKDFKLKAENK